MTGRNYARPLTSLSNVSMLGKITISAVSVPEGYTQVSAGMPEASLEKTEQLIQSPSPDSLMNRLEDCSLNFYFTSYLKFGEDVKNGLLRAALCLSYMDHVASVVSLLEAVQTNNFFYAKTLHEMAQTCLFFFLFFFVLFFFLPLGGQDYARYLSFYELYLANIEDSHPGANRDVSYRNH